MSLHLWISNYRTSLNVKSPKKRILEKRRLRIIKKARTRKPETVTFPVKKTSTALTLLKGQYIYSCFNYREKHSTHTYRLYNATFIDPADPLLF